MTEYLILGIVVVTCAVGLFFVRDRDRDLEKRLKAFSPSSIADATEGAELRLVGRAEAIAGVEPLVAPFSGRACVAYRILVREQRGQKTKHWVTLVEEDRAVDFDVVDATGRARVDSAAVHIALDADAAGLRNAFQQSPRLEEFLAERKISSGAYTLGKSTMTFKEGVLELGETVTLAGTGSWESDPAQRGEGYRGESGKRLRIRPLSSGKVLASDDRDLTKSTP